MRLNFHIWRQRASGVPGRLVRYEANGLNPDMSMLEALDVLNEDLILRGEDPIVFEHDCREGICGSCGFVINGVAHGPLPETTVCQLSLRHFEDGQELVLEPWRARAFPVLRDLMVDRSAFDRIVAAGGYISVPAGRQYDPGS
jgi:succinate dehydrogenase / fumarate reductase iron-sulfur subunit